MQKEAIFRTALIKHFKKHHCHVWRLEPNFRGKWGVADLLVFSPRMNKCYFVECKTSKGKISEDQKDFKALCDKCHVNYVVADKVEDIDCMIPASYSSKYNHIEDFYRKHPEMR